MGLASCGIKGSNDFKEVNFQKITPVQIMYGDILYKADIIYVNSSLSITFTDSASALCGLSVAVDDMNCKITYNSLSRSYAVEKLKNQFMPVIIYDFLVSLGQVIKTEDYNESDGVYSISRITEKYSVCLNAEEIEGKTEYQFVIT